MDEKELLDYGKLLEYSRSLEKQIQNYQALFAMNGITKLSLMVDEFITFSRKRLREIVAEAKLADFDKEQIQILLRLAEYLFFVSEEVRSLSILHLEGKWVEHPVSRKVDLDMETLEKMFARKENFVMLDDDEMEQFHQELVGMIEVVSKFCKTSGEVE